MSWSFEELCLPHRQAMLLYARRLCRRDPHAAADVVQDAMVRALNAWHAFVPEGEPSSSAKGWLYRIVTNMFVTTYHHGKRRRDVLSNGRADYMLVIHGVLDECDAPSDDGSSELGDECLAALNDLDPERRDVVHRADVLGHSYRRIAEDLGISIGTVMSRLHRGRDLMQVALADYAREEYGIQRLPGRRNARSQGDHALLGAARVGAEVLEPAELVEQDAHDVDGIMAGDDCAVLAVG